MNWNDFFSECTFSATRSGGPGGQHANKVATQVELRFDLGATELLNPTQKALALTRLSHRLTKDQVLLLTSSEARSQLANKEKVQARFQKLLLAAIEPPKVRKKRRTPNWVKRKRLDNKQRRSEKKQNRKSPDW